MSDGDGALESAAHWWESLADYAERKAAWDRGIGVDLSAAGQSAGDHRARTFRTVAKALRLEAATGLHHCHAHLSPGCRECGRVGG